MPQYSGAFDEVILHLFLLQHNTHKMTMKCFTSISCMNSLTPGPVNFNKCQVIASSGLMIGKFTQVCSNEIPILHLRIIGVVRSLTHKRSCKPKMGCSLIFSWGFFYRIIFCSIYFTFWLIALVDYSNRLLRRKKKSKLKYFQMQKKNNYIQNGLLDLV